ncbi:MAG: signal recognition particle receptor subunit alpha, partial [Methanoregula sp.]
MFSGLKERLQAARNRLSGSIGAAVEASPSAPAGQKSDPEKTGDVPSPSATPPIKSPTLVDKVKILIIDRELVVSEKDVSEALDELEMTLLESDVALPVADAIISDIRTGLVGKHRKIGESVDSLVVGALKSALLHVLGKGFDLPAYIKAHERPVKILFTGVNGTGKTTTV